jgi:hypothetical protein
MVVENGAPRLPEQRLSRSKFDDIVVRVFASHGGSDPDALWHLAMAAAEAEHGTMLVVSADARGEAERLRNQALTVESSRLQPAVIRQVTSIDGAVLVDPHGECSAIGVILDGVAGDDGDRSRGARYNSAIRYMSSTTSATVIILVSEDGMINLLPNLMPQVRRSGIEILIEDLREAARIDPVHPERFYAAYDRVKARAFYLSEAQCGEANSLRDDHWKRRRAAGAQIWIAEAPLVPNPRMSDSYLLDE